MLVLLGCSGAGKSTIAKILHESYGYEILISYTTRPPRENEKDGVDYHFITKEDFLNKKNDGFFVETAEYNGWFYGTAAKDCTDNKIAILTPHGLRQMRKINHICIYSIYIEVKRRERLLRLLSSREDIEEIKRRDSSDVGQFDGIKDEVDFVIDNSDRRSFMLDIASEINSLYKTWMENRAHKKLRILCDIDGVVDNLVECVLERYNKKFSDNLVVNDITEYNLNLFTKQECEDIFEECCDHELILGMSPLKNAVEEVTKLMKEHEFYFVSSTYIKNIDAKDRWLRKTFPLYEPNMLVIVNNKSLISGDVLIDDYVNNLNDNVKLNILFSRPWNLNKKIDNNTVRSYGWQDVANIINATFTEGVT